MARKTHFIRMAALLAFALLAACGGSTQPTDGDIPLVDAQISTPLPAPAIATNTPAGGGETAPPAGDQPPATESAPANDNNPPPAGDISVDFNGVSFELVYEIAGGWSAEWAQRGPGVLGLDGTVLFEDPAKTVFELQSYVHPGAEDAITLVVYPLEPLEDINDIAAERITELETFLKTEPLPAVGPDGPGIAVYPMIPAQQLFQSKVSRLDFRQGSGVRFVTAYSNGFVPVTNERLRYVYQGISSDRKWYVSVILPVSTTWIADTDADVPQEYAGPDYVAYLRENMDTINDAPGDSFTPSLDVLDAFVRSIGVGG